MIFTMDETVITLDDLNAERNIYYGGKDRSVPEEWKRLPRKSWPKHAMVALGILLEWCVKGSYRPGQF